MTIWNNLNPPKPTTTYVHVESVELSKIKELEEKVDRILNFLELFNMLCVKKDINEGDCWTTTECPRYYKYCPHCGEAIENE